MKMQFTSKKREALSGWSRDVIVDGQEYSVSVARGKRVRIAFRPRGRNIGWHWYAQVWTIGKDGKRVWGPERVPGSLGVRGILKDAGIIQCQESRV